MDSDNSTTGFFLLGFSDLPACKVGVFFVFLIIHVLTLIMNTLIIALVIICRHLHSPMYFFLCHLSLSDILFTVDIIPNVLYTIWKNGGPISLTACLTQFQIFGGTTSAQCLLLTAMSYDRYLAICRPLHYSHIMKPRLQYLITMSSWLLGHAVTLIITTRMTLLRFCGSNIIDHYFCDFAPILNLSCSDVSVMKLLATLSSSMLVPPPFFVIVGTYCYIFLTILKMSSSSGRHKAFYTCSSHLIVVCTYYGSLIAVYLSSSNGQPTKANKLLSLLNTVVTPLLNPVIYSLRNADIRKAVIGLYHTRLNSKKHTSY